MQEKLGEKDLKEINFNHWGRSFLADFQPLGTLLKKFNFNCQWGWRFLTTPSKLTLFFKINFNC